MNKILGKAIFVAFLDGCGFVVEFGGQKRVTKDQFFDIEIDAHGHLLGIERGMIITSTMKYI